jgi:hypothetical protein
MPDVVACDLAADDHAELVAQIEKLRHRTALLGAVVALLVAVLRVSKIQLDYERIPNGGDKGILLRAIARTRKVLPLSAALRITRLSASRYHGWCRAEAGCDLDDQSSCPRVVPTRLTPSEVETVREMVESDDHRHMSRMRSTNLIIDDAEAGATRRSLCPGRRQRASRMPGGRLCGRRRASWSGCSTAGRWANSRFRYRQGSRPFALAVSISV